MIISVVSGKGGAGKTSLAVSIAHVLGAEFFDFDVDAPNAEHFLHPDFTGQKNITLSVPEIDEQSCTACGLCVRECRFNALIKILDHIEVSESMCHGCGLCHKVCPQHAISERDHIVGTIRSGYSALLDNTVHVGDLEIGIANATHLIEVMASEIPSTGTVVIDGPPGNSCSAVAAINPADLVILVVEPTPFGFHDMEQTEEILNTLGKQYVIVANKVLDEDFVTAFFRKRGVKCSLSLPLDEGYHRAQLEGQILSHTFPQVYNDLQEMLAREMDAL